MGSSLYLIRSFHVNGELVRLTVIVITWKRRRRRRQTMVLMIFWGLSIYLACAAWAYRTRLSSSISLEIYCCAALPCLTGCGRRRRRSEVAMTISRVPRMCLALFYIQFIQNTNKLVLFINIHTGREKKTTTTTAAQPGGVAGTRIMVDPDRIIPNLNKM